MKLPQNISPVVAQLPDVTKDVIANRMRSATLPEVYVSLVEQIKSCTEMLTIEYFSDAAEALCAFAKIQHDSRLMRQAKRLKMWACWSAARAAERLRPSTLGKRNGNKGALPGAPSLLREHGIKPHAAVRMLQVGRLSETEMERELSVETVPSMLRIARLAVGRGIVRKQTYSESVAKVIGTYGNGGKAGNLASHASFCRTSDPALAQHFTPQEAKRARQLLVEIQEWHDAFEQMLGHATGPDVVSVLSSGTDRTQ